MSISSLLGLGPHVPRAIARSPAGPLGIHIAQEVGYSREVVAFLAEEFKHNKPALAKVLEAAVAASEQGSLQKLLFEEKAAEVRCEIGGSDKAKRLVSDLKTKVAIATEPIDSNDEKELSRLSKKEGAEEALTEARSFWQQRGRLLKAEQAHIKHLQLQARDPRSPAAADSSAEEVEKKQLRLDLICKTDGRAPHQEIMPGAWKTMQDLTIALHQHPGLGPKGSSLGTHLN